MKNLHEDSTNNENYELLSKDGIKSVAKHALIDHLKLPENTVINLIEVPEEIIIENENPESIVSMNFRPGEVLQRVIKRQYYPEWTNQLITIKYEKQNYENYMTDSPVIAFVIEGNNPNNEGKRDSFIEIVAEFNGNEWEIK